MQICTRSIVALLALALLLVSQAGGQDKAKGGKDKVTAKLSPEENRLVELTNQARGKEKLPPLKVNPVLMKAAALHTANMAKQGKLEHELDGKKVRDRLDDLGYKWAECGENIATDSDPNEAFKGWMESKGHRENILDPSYEEIGVALVRNPKDKDEFYFTQVFGKPMRKKK